MPRLRLAPTILVPVFLLTRAAAAQTPAAPEFIVNTATLNAQDVPSLSMDALGNFVIAWDSNLQDGSSYGVFAQRFDAAGQRVGSEFVVNTITAGAQYDADVAVDARGDFVVAWTGVGPEIFARRFDRSGAPLGAEFRANTYGTSTQNRPAVAVDPAGNFVVVWQSGGQDGNGDGVFGHRFNAAGASMGSDFQVNTVVNGNQALPDVAFTADGGFVVAFQGPLMGTSHVHARRFDAAGAPIGAEFSLSTSPLPLSGVSVAARPQGGFVVAWTSYFPPNLGGNGVFGRIFNANGVPVAGEFSVNTYTTDSQAFPAVAVDGRGHFVVIWESLLQDGSAAGVFGQRFDATGARRGGEFQLNAFTTNSQFDVTLAVDSAGNFTGAWGSAGQDGSIAAVVGRRFQGLLPSALAVDPQDGGVLERNETVPFEPSWRNATTATQTFQGTLSNFTGPMPASYSIPDALANYGATPVGTVRSCRDAGNCYALTVTASSRPVQHWDATALESLSGPAAAAGLQRQWVIHVGDSFTDVPRTNAFYRYIETLFHHGVTGGCTATTYCPGGTTTRAQMAVFLLVAREGPGYQPAACGTPMFPDVPASSPFCPWIEELARRGVVGGCGGGLYCPGDAVTREQMSVFVLRTLEPFLTPAACVPPNLFADVPESSPFCRWIEELANRGVVGGCGGGNYCPTASVTREQMGVFISVAFGLTLYGP